MPEELTLDTQEETTEELDTIEEIEESDEVADQDDDQEEESKDEGIPDDAFGGDEDEADNSDEPLGDLKALVKDNPDALARANQVEAGLIKLQNQKAEAENDALPMRAFIEGVATGNVGLINQFEQHLYDATGLTFESLIQMQGGTANVEKPQTVDNSKLANIEKKLEALETERAATKWITEVGNVVSASVARETGLEFSPELLWEARPYLKAGAKVEDVRKAVMRTNPDAYDKAVAKRDGGKSQTPRAATLPTGRGGVQKGFSHDHNGFLKAYEAKKARTG